MNVELLLSNENGTKLYQPAVEEGIQWTTQRRSTPGKLTFNVLKDDILDFSEGSAVRLRVDNKNIFYGWVFTQSRSKDKLISVTAYDQLRYLKNKDTYVYTNKTAAQLIQMLAADFNLKMGTLAPTGFLITSRVEENTTLLDMIENALDLELTNNKQMYILYDDFGKLTLKNINSMYVVDNSGNYLVIDEETGENFEYSSSIDSDVYNKIKLTYDNEESGKRDVYIAQDSTNINRWGVLQYYDTLSEGENGQTKANALLSLYNKKRRSLSIKNALGDTRVRAGSLPIINLDLGDTKIQNFMMCEKVTHTFKENEHFMDLSLRGGEFIA